MNTQYQSSRPTPPRSKAQLRGAANRKRALHAAQLRKLNRTYALLSAVNQMIVRVREPQALFEAACRIAVEQGGFYMAFISLLAAPTQQFQLGAYAAKASDHLEKLRQVLADDVVIQNSLAAALRHGEAIVVNDIANNARPVLWQGEMLQLGCRAFAALPLRVAGVVRGTLNLFAAEVQAFDPAELKLLAEMAADLSFALEFMEQEAQRKQAEADLRESEERFAKAFHQSPIALAIIDLADNTVREANEAVLELTKLSRAEIIGHTALEMNLQVDAELRAEIRREMQAHGLFRNKEMQLRLPNGETRYVLNSGARITLGGRPHHLGLLLDITERKQAETELQLQTARLQASAGAAQAFASITHDYAALLEHVLRYTSKVFGDYCAVRLFSADGQWLNTVASYDPDPELLAAIRLAQAEAPLRAGASDLVAQVAELGQPALVPVVAPSEIRAFMRPEVWLPFGDFAFHSLMIVPLRAQGRNLGALSLSRFRAGQQAFTDADLILAQDLADRAALAIANAHLLVQVQNELAERTQAEAKIEYQLRRLSALRATDLAISSSFDLRIILSVLLEHSLAQLGVDAAVVLLLTPSLNELEYAAGRGFRDQGITRLRLKLGDDYAGEAALKRQLVSVPNLVETERPFTKAELVANEKFVAFYAVPLIAKGQIKGVLEVFHRAPLDPDAEWLEFLETLAAQAAIAVDSAQLFDGLQRSNVELALAYDATIEGWSRAMDLRDKETEGHTQRVTELTLQLARAAGLSSEQIAHVRRGALLHDIGKLGVPDAILLKPGKLNEDEWVIMRQHPQYAYDMLVAIDYLRPALDIPYCHHEKWDGTGYPRGLKGEQIPLVARLFAVVDVWDALRSDRPYRAGWPQEKVLEHIQAQAGTHFDPQAVTLFMQVMFANYG